MLFYNGLPAKDRPKRENGKPVTYNHIWIIAYASSQINNAEMLPLKFVTTDKMRLQDLVKTAI